MKCNRTCSSLLFPSWSPWARSCHLLVDGTSIDKHICCSFYKCIRMPLLFYNMPFFPFSYSWDFIWHDFISCFLTSKCFPSYFINIYSFIQSFLMLWAYPQAIVLARSKLYHRAKYSTHSSVLKVLIVIFIIQMHCNILN